MIPIPNAGGHLLLLLLLLTGCGWAVDAMPTDPRTMGRILCEHLDPDHAGIGEVRARAAAGDHLAALRAWRDWKVVQLRQADLGQFGWHGDQLNGRRLAFADFAVGRMTQAEYEQKNPPATGFFVDRYGIAGPTGAARPIDWLARDGDGGMPCDYANFYFAVPFAARYWQGGDPAYLGKWFQVAADFSRNQRRLVDGLPEKERRSLVCGWTVNAGSALAQGTRVAVIIRSLGLLCKSLPGTPREKDWMQVGRPMEGVPTREALDLIPPAELAQVALSLAVDHPVALLARYQKAGAVPNQRREGLAALLFIATLFPEFRESHDVLAAGRSGFADYLAGAFHRDGAMLEQSFNYNLGDAQSLKEMADWLRHGDPALAGQALAHRHGFMRAMAALVSPLIKLPAMSSYAGANPPPLWADATARARWQEAESPALADDDALVRQVLGCLAGQGPPPPFTSVTLPYAGYAVQRGGWAWDSPYLFLQACRRARGHVTMGRGAVQVTAYGRPLIVTAGVPVYGPDQLPVPDRPDFARINELLGEESSWKANTVLVDGLSQDSRTPVAQEGFATTVPDRWYTGPVFDYMESYHDEGYRRAGRAADAAREPDVVPGKEVSHLRQVIFLREQKLWLVADVILRPPGATATHSFQQNWCFPGLQTDRRPLAFGFGREQVVIDAEGRAIHTTDPQGPNVSLFHAISGNAAPLSYQVWHGRKDPWRGWYAPGFGSLLAAPQVAATWKSAASTVLITVIHPRAPGAGTEVLRVIDLPDAKDPAAAGLAIALPHGARAEVHATGIPHLLRSAASVEAVAQLLFTLTDATGRTSGLIIGERSDPKGAAAFARSDGGTTVREPFAAPTGFSWETGAAGIAPAYGR